MDILINLLPPQEKGEIKNLRRIGVILKIGFAAVCAIGVFLVFSYFINMMIKIQDDAVAGEIARFEQSQTYKEVLKTQDLLREYSKVSAKVKAGLKNQSNRWELISAINQIIPENIKLSVFSVDEEGAFTLKGIAHDREALLSLKSGLESCGKLSKVESPISNFVADKDIVFEFTAEVK